MKKKKEVYYGITGNTAGVLFIEDPLLLYFCSKGLKTDKLQAYVFEIDEDAKDEVSRGAPDQTLITAVRMSGLLLSHWATHGQISLCMYTFMHWNERTPLFFLNHGDKTQMWLLHKKRPEGLGNSRWLMAFQSHGPATSVTPQRRAEVRGRKSNSLTCPINSPHRSSSPWVHADILRQREVLIERIQMLLCFQDGKGGFRWLYFP